MKKSLFALMLGCMLLFTGCIDILEELWLNKDGSGKYKIIMDMSALMEEGGMRSMMEGMVEADSAEASVGMPMEQDTIIYMKDAPDSIRQRFVHKDLMDQMSMRVQVSEEKELMLMTFNFDFKKVSEINDFLEDLDNMQGNNALGAGAMSQGGGLLPSTKGGQKLFTTEKRLLKRLPTPADKEKMNSEELAMAKMMLSGATYRTIYHLPGNVKKVSNKSATIDGKTVTIETSLNDILDGKGMLETEIKYKK